jgi:hypothetical protein
VENNRLGTKSVKTLQGLLTDRDQAILQSVFDHKFLTTRQIYQLHFWNHASYGSAIRACTRVLARLHGHKLLYKIDRPVGGMGGGSASNVWGIDAAGDRLIKSALSPDRIKRARAFEPTSLFLAHTLAIADVRIKLEELARDERIELVDVVTEPTNWRPFLTRGGQTQVLKPDLFAITASGEFEDHWFIEIDRGTESIPTLIRKCHYYQRYHATGLEEEARGVFPWVIWLIPTAARRDRLREAIGQERRLDAAIFRVVDPNELDQQVLSGSPNERSEGPQAEVLGGQANP